MKTQHVQEAEPQPLGPKKTMLVMITVVGCIAILWPKVFYPMLTGPTPPKPGATEFRGPKPVYNKRLLKCCDVILDAEERYANSSAALNALSQHQSFRKFPKLLSDEPSVRQERPPHLRPDGMHPAMRERGRAIPAAHQVPPIPPKIIDGRPGPIPGMRPPMGAGSHHQATPKGNSMGFIMPLYTIGIVAFFVYTIMRLVCKKTPAPVPPQQFEKNGKVEPVEAKEENGAYIKRPDEGRTKLAWKDHDAIVKAIQGIIEATDEHIQKHHILENNNVEPDHSKDEESNNLNKDTTTIEKEPTQNGHVPSGVAENRVEEIIEPEVEQKQAPNTESANTNGLPKDKGHVEVMGIEIIATPEGGKKWSRPASPMLTALVSRSKHHESNVEHIDGDPIYLDTPVSPDSQILVADTDQSTTCVTDEAFDGTQDDPAVVLSGRVTLSLISPHLPDLRKSEERELHEKSKPADSDSEEKEIAMEVSNVVLMEKFLKDVHSDDEH